MSMILTIKEILESSKGNNQKNVALKKLFDLHTKEEKKKSHDAGYEEAIELLENEIYESGYESGYNNAYYEMAVEYNIPIDDVEEFKAEQAKGQLSDEARKRAKELVSVPNYSGNDEYADENESVQSPYQS